MRLSMALIYAVACFFAVGVQPAVVDWGASGNKEQSVAESMRRLSQEIFAAYERLDANAIKSYYARQPEALFFWERKLTYSWDQIEASLEGLVGAASELKLTTREFRSGGSGHIGWFAAAFHLERVSRDGQRISSDGRWTVIAERIDGRWLIVHEHASIPIPEQ